MARETTRERERRERGERYRASKPGIKPAKTKSVLGADERLSGTPAIPPNTRKPSMSISPGQPPEDDFDPMNPIQEEFAEEVVSSLPGPLERGARAIGGFLTDLQTPPAHPGGLRGQSAAFQPAPPRGAMMAIGPNPNKTAERAAVASAATAAVMAEHERDDPRAQGSNAKVPAPSASVKLPSVGTGPGAAAETPKKAAAAPGPGRTQVRMPDGRIVFVTENQGKPHVQAGGEYISYQDAITAERAGGALGKPQAARFMKGRMSRPMEAAQPYSQKVRALASEDAPDLSEQGTPYQRDGYRKLSGIEQAIERRQWLEGRADTEQARETERAELDRRTRLAEMDPLEMARIQAQGRMGGDIAKVELDLRSRQAAIEDYRAQSALIDKAQAALSALPPGSPDALALKDYIDGLILQRRELSNLTLGRYLSNPQRGGDLEALMAMMASGGAGAGSPPVGAR